VALVDFSGSARSTSRIQPRSPPRQQYDQLQVLDSPLAHAVRPSTSSTILPTFCPTNPHQGERRRIVWDDRVHPTLLIRENATLTYPRGRTRMTRTRLKTGSRRRLDPARVGQSAEMGGRREASAPDGTRTLGPCWVRMTPGPWVLGGRERSQR
jgi:hypothetical protein